MFLGFYGVFSKETTFVEKNQIDIHGQWGNN